MSLREQQIREILDEDQRFYKARYELEKKAARMAQESYAPPNRFERAVAFNIDRFFIDLRAAIDNVIATQAEADASKVIQLYEQTVRYIDAYAEKRGLVQRDVSVIEDKFDALKPSIQNLVYLSTNLGWRVKRKLENIEENIENRTYSYQDIELPAKELTRPGQPAPIADSDLDINEPLDLSVPYEPREDQELLEQEYRNRELRRLQEQLREQEEESEVDREFRLRRNPTQLAKPVYDLGTASPEGSPLPEKKSDIKNPLTPSPTPGIGATPDILGKNPFERPERPSKIPQKARVLRRFPAEIYLNTPEVKRDIYDWALRERPIVIHNNLSEAEFIKSSVPDLFNYMAFVRTFPNEKLTGPGDAKIYEAQFDLAKESKIEKKRRDIEHLYHQSLTREEMDAFAKDEHKAESVLGSGKKKIPDWARQRSLTEGLVLPKKKGRGKKMMGGISNAEDADVGLPQGMDDAIKLRAVDKKPSKEIHFAPDNHLSLDKRMYFLNQLDTHKIRDEEEAEMNSTRNLYKSMEKRLKKLK